MGRRRWIVELRVRDIEGGLTSESNSISKSLATEVCVEQDGLVEQVSPSPQCQ